MTIYHFERLDFTPRTFHLHWVHMNKGKLNNLCSMVRDNYHMMGGSFSTKLICSHKILRNRCNYSDIVLDHLCIIHKYFHLSIKSNYLCKWEELILYRVRQRPPNILINKYIAHSIKFYLELDHMSNILQVTLRYNSDSLDDIFDRINKLYFRMSLSGNCKLMQ